MNALPERNPWVDADKGRVGFGLQTFALPDDREPAITWRPVGEQRRRCGYPIKVFSCLNEPAPGEGQPRGDCPYVSPSSRLPVFPFPRKR